MALSSSGDRSLERRQPQPLPWEDRDKLFATLFGPAEGISPHTGTSTEQNLLFLRSLDSIIASFEECIGHTDSVFYTWRARHQRAMSEGQQPVTMDPKLGIPNRNGVRKWHDHVWNKRYTFWVRHRSRITRERLEQVFKISEDESMDFFGTEDEADREMWLAAQPHSMALVSTTRKRRPVTMRHQWYKPLDALLQSFALKKGFHVATVKLLFWDVTHVKDEIKTEGVGMTRKREETALEVEMPPAKRARIVDFKREMMTSAPP